MVKRIKEPTTHIIKRGDGDSWYITFNRDDGFGAFVGENCLGYAPDQHLAEAWIEEYQYQQALQAGRQVAA